MRWNLVDVAMSIFAAIGIAVSIATGTILLYHLVAALVLYVGGCM